MDWDKLLFNDAEKPLDTFADGYSHTSAFRNMAFIGDSLSSGEFESRDKGGNPHYYDFFEYSWGQYIARKNGLMAYNFSRGGMTAKEYIEYFAEQNGFWSKEKACEAYVIALGINEVFNGDMEIGDIGDIDEADYTKNQPTYAGYYAQIVSRYKEIAPDAKFFFVTMPNDEALDSEKLARMVQLMYDMAEHFDNCYVIDLFKFGPVYDKKFREKFFLYGHLSPSGYILTARMIDSYIDYLVRHNSQDFKKVGFINKDIESC